ncbi:MAG: hypothetical protein AAB434_07450 [Planctomycetota bacterium]
MQRIALVLSLLSLVAGCKTQADPDAVGEGSWIRDTCRPYEVLNAEHGVQAFWLEKVNETTYKVTLKPSALTNIPSPYPGSKLLDSTNMVVSEERIYSIPEGRTFVDVWEHYTEWFHFGQPSKSGAPR